MIIYPATIREEGTFTAVASEIEYGSRKETLWYSVDKRYSQYLTTEKLDGFVVGLLPLAMETGEDIIVKGPVSEKLFYNLSHHYMGILRLTSPSYKSIEIVPDSLTVSTEYICEGAVATGFSAGIDSLCTVHDYLLSDIPPSYKITHFIFNNAGSHGEWDTREARVRFNTRYNFIKGFADRLRIEFIKIDTNLSDILRMEFRKTHVPRNISCALILQKLIGKLYYSSALRYQDSYIGPANDHSFSEPFSVPLLSTETLECISTGSQYSRIEKTKRVIVIEDSRKWLNVCLFPQDPERVGNCSCCGKCLLTMFTLELLGVLEQYSEVFDLDIWSRQRNLYIVTTILGKSRDPLVVEAREYINGIGYIFPLWQRLLGTTLRFVPDRIIWKVINMYRRVEYVVFHRNKRNKVKSKASNEAVRNTADPSLKSHDL